MLARLALTSKAAECVVQHVEKRCLTDILLHHAIETLAMESATEIEIVLARRAPGQTDFCDIGARATIGATPHSYRNRFVREAVEVEGFVDLPFGRASRR